MTASAADPLPAAQTPAPVRFVRILANPAAGGYRKGRIAAVAAALEAEGIAAEILHSRAPGDIARLAGRTLDPPDVLAVAGGDGSINEAVSGLLKLEGPRPRLAVVPAGTANVLAAEMRLPRGSAAIARAIAAGASVPLHYGLADGLPFLLMTSAGFDAEVVHAVPGRLKRHLKQLAFVITALRIGFGRSQPDIQVEADGASLTGRLAIVTQAQYYGGPHVLVRAASVTRAGLHLVLIADDRPAALLRVGLALLSGRVESCRGVTVRPVRDVRLGAATPVAVQRDGEACGTTPVSITTGGGALALVVPPPAA